MAQIASTTKNVLVVAGDPSGDLHASRLIKALEEKDPGICVTSIGGVRMREVSTHFIYNLVSVGAVGFAEPFKNFFLWLKLIRLVRRYMEEKKPACVIAVDFYGFNHQILGLAAHRKIPAYYYISPQVWASRPGRAKSIARLTKEIFVIFPFEEAIYAKAGGRARFLGHPLLDIIPEEPAKKPAGEPLRIGLLPGSRRSELERHLPLFVKAFYKIKSVHADAKGYVFAVPEFPDEKLLPMLADAWPGAEEEIEIVRESDYAVRGTLDFAFTASGTATLENALLGVPMLVAYRMPRFTYEIAKRVITVPYISLVNVLLKKPAVKELIQDKATVELLSQEAFSVLNNPPKAEAMRRDYRAVREMLGEKGVAARAAERIAAVFK